MRSAIHCSLRDSTIFLPTDPAWTGLDIYGQGFYIDAAGLFGVSATNGLHITVR